MKSHFVNRFIAGTLLFIPISFLLVGLYYGYSLFKDVIEPLLGMLDVETVWGFLILNLIVVFSLALFIYLIGYLAEMPVIANRIHALDRVLTGMVPGYSMIKGIVGGVVKEDAMLDGMRPVIVPHAGGHRLGFEVERTPTGLVMVFLPNAPTVNSGISVAFRAERVVKIDIPPHRVMEIQSFHGRGLAADIERLGMRQGNLESPPEDTTL